jgi:hypothetical protein
VLLLYGTTLFTVLPSKGGRIYLLKNVTIGIGFMLAGLGLAFLIMVIVVGKPTKYFVVALYDIVAYILHFLYFVIGIAFIVFLRRRYKEGVNVPLFKVTKSRELIILLHSQPSCRHVS